MTGALPPPDAVLDLLALFPDAVELLAARVRGLGRRTQVRADELQEVLGFPIDRDTASAIWDRLTGLGVIDVGGRVDSGKAEWLGELANYTQRLRDELATRIPRATSRLVVTVADVEEFRDLGWSLDLRPLVQLVEDVIRSAEREVIVGSPFWTEKALERLRPAIAGLLGRGGSVVFVTQGGPQASSTTLEMLERFVFALRYRGRGARLYLFQGHVRSGQELVLHAKFALADEKLGYLGSANMTHQGLASNFELGVRISATEVLDLREVLEAFKAAGFIREHSVAPGP